MDKETPPWHWLSTTRFLASILTAKGSKIGGNWLVMSINEVMMDDM